MQDTKSEKNKKLCKLLGNVIKELNGQKKKSILAYESDLPRSVLYYILDGKKDPQLSTFWRLALGLNMRPSELLKILEDKMENGWDSFLD